MAREVKFKIAILLDKGRSDYREVKGKLFESLVGRFLGFQSYAVQERMRQAGTEIDLKCISKLSSEVAIVECKARSEIAQTDAVNKVHGDVAVEDASHGWIFAISDIGKEAQASIEKLNEKAGKSRYRFFPPATAAGRAMSNF